MDQSVAVLGPKGTFSDLALAREQERDQSASPPTPCYCKSIDAVFTAVGSSCSAGLVPIENTLDGYVQRTLDLLLETPVRVIGELQIPIQFALIANTPSQQEIRRLYVQFKASGQCRQLVAALQEGGAEVVLTESNMASFEQVEHHKIPGDAAVIPVHQRHRATASFVLDNVTDAKHNRTRFIRIVPAEFLPQKEEVIFPEARRIRIPLYILPPDDRPGVLYELLRPLHAQQINLVSIISRPTKKHIGAYHFYLELDGPLSQKEQILAVLSQIGQDYPLKMLGVYPV